MIRQELGRAELRHVENDQMIQTANLVELLSDTIIGTAPLNVNSQPFDVHGIGRETCEPCGDQVYPPPVK